MGDIEAGLGLIQSWRDQGLAATFSILLVLRRRNARGWSWQIAVHRHVPGIESADEAHIWTCMRMKCFWQLLSWTL